MVVKKYKTSESLAPQGPSIPLTHMRYMNHKGGLGKMVAMIGIHVILSLATRHPNKVATTRLGHKLVGG